MKINLSGKTGNILQFVFVVSVSVASMVAVAWLKTKPQELKLDRMPLVASGCSCSLESEKGEYLGGSEAGVTSPFIVTVSGKRVEFQKLSETPQAKEEKVGDTFQEVYASGPLKLTLNYTKTFVCPEESESCEVTRYSIDAILDNGNQKTEIKNLKGDCGC